MKSNTKIRTDIEKQLKSVKITVLSPSNPDIALDLGTGTGNVACILSGLIKKVIAFDISELNLKECRRNVEKQGIKNIEICHGSSDFLPFKNESFDIVNCSGAFHHFPNPIQVLTEVYRVLKRHGQFRLYDPVMTEHTERVWGILSKIKESNYIKYYSYNEYMKMLRDAGFRVYTMIPGELQRLLDEWIRGDFTVDMGRAETDGQHRLKEIMLGLDNKVKEEMRFTQKENRWVFYYDVLEIGAQII